MNTVIQGLSDYFSEKVKDKLWGSLYVYTSPRNFKKEDPNNTDKNDEIDVTYGNVTTDHDRMNKQ